MVQAHSCLASPPINRLMPDSRLVVIGENLTVPFAHRGLEKLTEQEDLYLDPTRTFDERIGALEGGRPVMHPRDEPVLEERRHFLACARDRLEPIGSGAATVAAVRTLEALPESLEWGSRLASVQSEKVCGMNSRKTFP